MNRIENGCSANFKDTLTYGDVEKIANELLSCTDHRPKIGVICGSGLGDLADLVQDTWSISYKDIPHFPVSTVAGHAGKLVFGNLRGKPVVLMQGRTHMFEGYSLQKVVLPIRVMKLLGVETLIVTNASGGLNPEYKVGDIMLIKDHIFMAGFSGKNPLVGPNDDRFGCRFPAMSNAYDKQLRCMAWSVSKEIGFDDFTREGVYVMVGGPTFETVGEARLLRAVGADAAGMSTCPEVVVARHCGLKVLGLSLITNEIILDYESEASANHEEVLETSKARSQDLQVFVSKMVERMPDL